LIDLLAEARDQKLKDGVVGWKIDTANSAGKNLCLAFCKYYQFNAIVVRIAEQEKKKWSA